MKFVRQSLILELRQGMPLEAGFDGVQIQANYLYLIAQFLNSGTNLRKDEYGGSTVNRARFLFEIIETVLEYVEPGRVGIKIGPMNHIGAFRATPTLCPIWST